MSHRIMQNTYSEAVAMRMIPPFQFGASSLHQPGIYTQGEFKQPGHLALGPSFINRRTSVNYELHAPEPQVRRCQPPEILPETQKLFSNS